MKNKETAVDWLVEQVNLDCLNSVFIKPDLVKQAKEMEKEQIVEAHLYGLLRPLVDKPVIQAEEFYNEIYKTPKP